MFLADNLGFFAGLNDFKFALKSRLKVFFWLSTTVHFDSSAWMALDDFLVIFCSKIVESSSACWWFLDDQWASWNHIYQTF